ncbi:MAG: ParB N-terminal domain-containing protein [bacterium]
MAEPRPTTIIAPDADDKRYKIVSDLEPLLVPIDAIAVDPTNARAHPPGNISAIAGSLNRYGQRKPIVVNRRDNTIEAGNGTWDAAKLIRWTHIAVVFVDDDPHAATGYALADNRTTDLSYWDTEILADLLKSLDLSDANAAAYADVGFDEQFVRTILDAADLIDLDAMEQKLGALDAEDMLPFLRIQTTEEGVALYESHMRTAPAHNPIHKFVQIMQAVDPHILSEMEAIDDEEIPDA